MSRMTYTPGAQQPQGIPQPQQQSPFRRHHHHQQQQQQQHRYSHPSSSYPPHRQPQQQQPATKPSHIPHQQTWVDTLIYTLDALPPPTTWPSHILDTCLIQPLTFILAIITSPRTHRLILRLSLLTTVFWTALALAIAAYIAFYNAWVPHLGLRVPVYLQYGEQGTAPWADVYFDPPGKFFADDQQYDVTLELTVPLTPANLDLGNFMVSINMYADSSSSEPVIISSRPTLLHPSASALNALSSFLSRNPNPDISPFGISAPGGAVSSSYSGPPLTLLSVPLLRRAILQVGSASSIPTSPPSPPKSKTSSLQRERTPSANGLPGQVGVRHPSQSIARARITVGRSDAERYWMYGGGHGHGNGNGNGGKEAFVSRGELQTHAVSLRFDAHLTGLRFFMYHYPLTSFFTFTSLFLACELAAAFFVAGIFALYSTIANSNIDVRTSDEAFVTPSSIKRAALDGEKRVKPEDGGVKREGGYQEDDEDDDEEEEEEGAGEAESLTTTSSALGVYDEDEDDDDDNEVLDDELEDTPEGRAYRSQMAARARTRVERASTGAAAGGGGEYDDSDETERELEMGMPSSSRRGPTSTSTSQPSGVGAPPLGPGRPGERRVLGRLDEETEEETDQTATTTTTSRRATASAGMGTPVSSSSTRVPPPPPVAAQGTPEIGFGTEEEEDEEEGEERRAQRTRARWEAWSASQGGSTSVPAPAPPVEAEAEAEGEHSPSASWESVGAEEEEEDEEVDDERAAMAEAASLAEARRLKEEEEAAAGEGDVPVAGPSGTSRRAPPPAVPVPEAEAVLAPAPAADMGGPSLAEAARAEDELSTATEEEGEEGAKTAG
ncbi:hypothetical protein A4X09_0g4159 [Tilletia walkeri]|uniref:Seipin n=1 Tax=Tilletia walkeri TaxID=117179 RepID=A0A8X7N6N5_9BASI|nr:hypothetical protein A4X09_0g4159 [Tilletia walkeri]